MVGSTRPLSRRPQREPAAATMALLSGCTLGLLLLLLARLGPAGDVTGGASAVGGKNLTGAFAEEQIRPASVAAQAGATAHAAPAGDRRLSSGGSPPPQVSTIPTGLGVSTLALAANPAAFRGMTVEVRGTLTRLLDPRALVVDRRVLVLSALPFDERLARGRAPSSRVALRGELRMVAMADIFDVAAAERYLGVDFDESRLAEWSGRAAIYLTASDHAQLMP